MEIEQSTEQDLLAALKRCSEPTREAALRFRRTGDLAQVPILVRGILERFIEPAAAASLATGGRDVRLAEDLGMDSLLTMEAVLLLEECFALHIPGPELRKLRTVGELEDYLAAILTPPLPPAD